MGKPADSPSQNHQILCLRRWCRLQNRPILHRKGQAASHQEGLLLASIRCNNGIRESRFFDVSMTLTLSLASGLEELPLLDLQRELL